MSEIYTSLFLLHSCRSVQVQAWNEHSQSNKDKAEMEMARSQKLRELIFHLIEQTTNDLRVQGGARFN